MQDKPLTGTDSNAVRLELLDYAADVVVFIVVVAGPTVRTAGGTHEPFSADSCGQY